MIYAVEIDLQVLMHIYITFVVSYAIDTRSTSVLVLVPSEA